MFTNIFHVTPEGVSAIPKSWRSTFPNVNIPCTEAKRFSNLKGCCFSCKPEGPCKWEVMIWVCLHILICLQAYAGHWKGRIWNLEVSRSIMNFMNFKSPYNATFLVTGIHEWNTPTFINFRYYRFCHINFVAPSDYIRDLILQFQCRNTCRCSSQQCRSMCVFRKCRVVI